MSKRIKYSNRGDAFEIQISAKKLWYPLIFFAVWLTGWTIGIVFAFGALFYGSHPEKMLFLLVWLCFALVFEVLVAYIWSWMAFGKEIVRIAPGNLFYKKELFGYGRTKTYATNSIIDLRASGSFDSPFDTSFKALGRFWGLTGGNVAFEYEGATCRFGIWLTEPEARQVVEKIREFLGSKT